MHLRAHKATPKDPCGCLLVLMNVPALCVSSSSSGPPAGWLWDAGQDRTPSNTVLHGSGIAWYDLVLHLPPNLAVLCLLKTWGPLVAGAGRQCEGVLLEALAPGLETYSSWPHLFCEVCVLMCLLTPCIPTEYQHTVFLLFTLLCCCQVPFIALHDLCCTVPRCYW